MDPEDSPVAENSQAVHEILEKVRDIQSSLVQVLRRQPSLFPNLDTDQIRWCSRLESDTRLRAIGLRGVTPLLTGVGALYTVEDRQIRRLCIMLWVLEIDGAGIEVVQSRTVI